MQILFKDHGARNTYAKWDRKLEGISYLSYSGDLTDEEESVISGVRSDSAFHHLPCTNVHFLSAF